MIKKKNLYVRPKKLYEKARIEEEDKLVLTYGLKNKREVWKTLAKMNYFRKRAKSLSESSPEEQELFFKKLQTLGLEIKSIADVLDLSIEKLLDRRLPTIVLKLNLATTIKQARQIVVHKRILINKKVVNIPSYLVTVEEESLITLVKKQKAKPKAEPVEEPKESSEESEKPTENKEAKAE